MTIKQIERTIRDLTGRVQQLHSGDWIVLSYASGSWSCRTFFTRIRSGACETPTQAIALFIEELRQSEARNQAA
jgi:hypothetical protein